MLQLGETEKRRNRPASGSHVYCAIAHLDFLRGLF
jgi:hypothetical protein